MEYQTDPMKPAEDALLEWVPRHTDGASWIGTNQVATLAAVASLAQVCHLALRHPMESTS
jgi:hypothetical protein